MAHKGTSSSEDQGIKGAKPRLREPKVPRRKETLETAQLGKVYLQRRNMMMKLKILREALALGIARDQLVEKRLVEHQLLANSLGWVLIRDHSPVLGERLIRCVGMSYENRSLNATCPQCKRSVCWQWKPGQNTRRPTDWNCRCGYSNTIAPPPTWPDIPRTLYVGHELNARASSTLSLLTR